MFPSRGWVGTPRLVDVGTDGGGARRPSEEKRANGTSLTALLTLNSHARTSEHTPVRRERTRISLHGPGESAPAKLCGALRRCLGAAPEGGQSKSARSGTNARHIGTNEAIADAMSTRGRRGGVRVTHWQRNRPVLRYAPYSSVPLFRRPKRGHGDRGARRAIGAGTSGTGGMKATPEASQSRWTWMCGGCMAANLSTHGFLEGPNKCARHDPGRNYYREMREEMERIAACRERRLRKEAKRLAKHRLPPEQSRRRERSSEASGPTVTTAQPKGKGSVGMRPISSYYGAPQR